MSPLVLTYNAADQSATYFIDNSSTERIDTCARSAEFYLSRRKEANADKPALTFGKILHKCLEYRYRNLHKSTIECVDSMINIAQAEFSKYTPPDGDYRNFAMAVDAIRHYADTYPFEPFELCTINSAPAVEIPFAVPLCTIEINHDMAYWDNGEVKVSHVKHIHVMWKGKIDIALRLSGRLYGMDHKSTSMMGPSYFSDFILSGQIYGYSWALEKILGELPYGFLINALGIRAPTKTGKKLEYSRYTVLIQRELIDEWYLDTTHKLADFFEMARRGYFPKQTKWCASKFGMCEYHAVCTLTGSMRETMLTTNMYKNVTWDPLKNED